MTPVVDEDLCIGCGACQEICPEVFELRGGTAYVIGPENCESCDCVEAANNCPVQAITLR